MGRLKDPGQEALPERVEMEDGGWLFLWQECRVKHVPKTLSEQSESEKKYIHNKKYITSLPAATTR
ncbi:hypothetical protein KSC_069770 [Ktedonobacter sp. SOSP1-52]|nr:hypothetical protein KSC_069770 [Ktedonobacter sp. SOSP1-52]